MLDILVNAGSRRMVMDAATRKLGYCDTCWTLRALGFWKYGLRNKQTGAVFRSIPDPGKIHETSCCRSGSYQYNYL